METLLKMMRAAAEPSRLRILSICAQGEFTVSELVQVLGQSQPRVSRHLKVLCDAGLLQRLREGSWVFYRFAPVDDKKHEAQQLVGMMPKEDPVLMLDNERLSQIKEGRKRAAAEYFRNNAAQWNKIRALHIDEVKVEEAIRETVLKGPVKKILDIGTGTGRLLEILSPEHKEVEGIDLSHEMLVVARANIDQAGLANCRVRHGDMYQLPYRDQTFDAAIINQVLHFADEPAFSIREAARILKNNGRLVVADFAPHSREELRSEHQHRHLGIAEHDMARWFKAAGLIPKPSKELPGGPLTVVLWSGVKPEQT